MGHKQTIDLSTENRSLGGLSGQLIGFGAVLAVLGLIGTLLLGNLEGAFDSHSEPHAAGGAAHSSDPTHSDDHSADHSGGDHGMAHGYVSTWSVWHPYLVSASWLLAICLGAIFFVLIHHVTMASWSTVVRRLAEAVSRNFVLMGLLFIPILMPGQMGKLYKWIHPDPGDSIIAVKEAYLNYDFFLIRMAIYFLIWIGISFWYHKNSVQQDADGDLKRTTRMAHFSPLGLILFAMSITFAAYDILMSLDAHWFSTIFGVYLFGGSVLSFHAFLALIVIWLQANGRLTRAVSDEHMQDIGKMMFAFTVFWAYIAFSQYMLYWYANIPEETAWFLRRQENMLWGSWGWLLIIGRFLIPFLFIMSKHVKRSRPILAVAAIWVLIMQWADMYYLVMPQINGGEEFPFTMVDVTIPIGFLGLFLIGLALSLRGHSLIAEKDPRMPESLAFENA
ncbi:quinol:cytochrome C oxidoreductase [Planctomycetota bacterium]|nr:quinol:cytochrome C oxidoreductase [Planctomycetota bacterium]